MQKRIFKDLLTYLPAGALPMLAAFITVPIYTHLFSPADFGNYALAVAASDFLVLGLVTGFGQAAVRFFSTYQLKSSLLSYFAVIFSSIGLITAAGVAISAGMLLIFHSLIPSDLYPLLWESLALFVVTVCYSTLMDVLRGQEKSRWYTVFSIGTSFGSIILGLLFVLKFGMGINGMIWGQTFGLLLPILPLIWLTTHSVAIHPAYLNRSTFNQLWKYALPYTIGNIAFWSLNLSDRYIVEIYRGSYEVGLYSLANKISRPILVLANLFFLVPTPIISRLWEEHGRQATEEALTGFTRPLFLMVIPAVAGLSVLAAPLVRLLADKAYYDCYPAIWLLACASLSIALGELGSFGCIVTNRTPIIARNQVLAAGVNLILTLVLVPVYGFMGAAWSTLLSFMLLAVLQTINSARFLTWHWPLDSLWRVLLASASMCASVLLIQAGLRYNTTVWKAVSLILSIVVGIIVYGLVLWALGEISPQQVFKFFKVESRQAIASPAIGKTEQK